MPGNETKFTIDGTEFGIPLSNSSSGGADADEFYFSPNPQSIIWTKENEIKEDPVPGKKPKTQCTILDGLWNCSISIKTADPDKKDFLKGLKPGPHVVETAFHTCELYLKSMSATQVEGNNDHTFMWQIEFKESND